MNDSRIAEAVEMLKNCKAQGLKYFEAKQLLGKQGFSQQEIDDASYEFPYENASPPEEVQTGEKAADQAIAEASIHDQAVDSVTNELYKDVGLGMLGGRSLVGQYYQNKTLGDFAALRDLETQGQKQQGSRVFQRHRAIKYYAILSLVPLVFMIPYLLVTIKGIVYLPGDLLSARNRSQLGLLSLYALSLSGCIYLFVPASLFLAKKETTIIKTIYILLGFEALAFIAVALTYGSPTFAIIGIAALLPGYWISKRVGLLSQVESAKSDKPSP